MTDTPSSSSGQISLSIRWSPSYDKSTSDDSDDSDDSDYVPDEDEDEDEDDTEDTDFNLVLDENIPFYRDVAKDLNSPYRDIFREAIDYLEEASELLVLGSSDDEYADSDEE